MPVGRLCSMVKLQGCADYEPIDIDRVRGFMMQLDRERSRNPGAEREKFRQELRECWQRIRRKLRKAAMEEDDSRSRSRGRSRRRRRKRQRSISSSPEASEASDKPDEATDPMNMMVEQFIRDNSLDESASSFIRKSPPPLQQYAIALGPLADRRNPSSALIKRITDGRRQLESAGLLTVRDWEKVGMGPRSGSGTAIPVISAPPAQNRKAESSPPRISRPETSRKDAPRPESSREIMAGRSRKDAARPESSREIMAAAARKKVERGREEERRDRGKDSDRGDRGRDDDRREEDRGRGRESGRGKVKYRGLRSERPEGGSSSPSQHRQRKRMP